MAVLALTTLARLKEYAQVPATDARASTDSVLAAMILSVSQRIAQYCSRDFAIASRVEAGVLSCDEFTCTNNPIVSIQSVRYSPTGRRADMTTLPATQYEISASGNNISIYDVAYGGIVEVTYTGGLASDTDDVIANEPALEDACKMQVTSLWKRHTIPDRTGMTLGSGDTQWTAEYGLLKDVRHVLDNQYNNRHRVL